jgi:hypothetical protein
MHEAQVEAMAAAVAASRAAPRAEGLVEHPFGTIKRSDDALLRSAG